MNVAQLADLLPVVMVVAVATCVYILLFRTRWTDEPRKQEGKRR